MTYPIDISLRLWTSFDIHFKESFSDTNGLIHFEPLLKKNNPLLL